MTQIPRNIPAFRAITTMLAQIQQVRAFKVSRSKTHPDLERQELMILDALATIIVIDNEVVAVVSKPDDAFSDKLEAIICIRLPNDENQLIAKNTRADTISRTHHRSDQRNNAGWPQP